MPNGRTSYAKITLTLGGMDILSGFVISSMILVNIAEIVYLQVVLASMIVLLLLILKDDIVGLIRIKKFVGQVIALVIDTDLGGTKL